MLYSKKIAAGAMMAGALVIASLSGTAALASDAPVNAPANSQPAVTVAACAQDAITPGTGSQPLTDEKTITLADGTVLTITWAGSAVSAGELKLDASDISTDSGNAIDIQISSASFTNVQPSPAQPEK